MEDTKEFGGGDADAVYLDIKNPDLSKLCLQSATAEVNVSSQRIANIKFHYPKEYAGTVRVVKSQERIEGIIKLLEFNRDNGPNGGILDDTKVSQEGIKAIKAVKALKASKLVPEEDVQSIEGQVMGRVLGSGTFCKEVIVVKDIKLGVENAMKTIMLAQFHGDQIKAWCLLADQGLAPKLHAFYPDNEKMVTLMEVMEGKTLNDVLNHELLKNPYQAISLSFCVLEGLLTSFDVLRKNNFTHGDMHAGNIMIQPETENIHSPQIKIKLFDFDAARRLLQESAKEGIDRIRNDLLRIMRMFCQLYSLCDPGEKLLQERNLKEVSENLGRDLTEEQRQELFKILTMLLDCISDPRQENFGDTSAVSNHINKKYPIGKLKKQIAVMLFPEHFQQLALEACDTAGMECELNFSSVWDDPDLEDFVEKVTDEALRDLGVILLT